MPTDTESVLGLMQRLRDAFPRVTEDFVGETIDALADNPGLPYEAKLASLTALHKRLILQINNLRSNVITVAPELWQNRLDKRENPVEFIRRVYSDYMGRGLSKAHIRRIDRPLYQSLSVWLARNPTPADFLLPTKQAQNDAVLAHLPLDKAFVIDHDTERMRSAARYRSRKMHALAQKRIRRHP